MERRKKQTEEDEQKKKEKKNLRWCEWKNVDINYDDYDIDEKKNLMKKFLNK